MDRILKVCPVCKQFKENGKLIVLSSTLYVAQLKSEDVKVKMEKCNKCREDAFHSK